MVPSSRREMVIKAGETARRVRECLPRFVKARSKINEMVNKDPSKAREELIREREGEDEGATPAGDKTPTAGDSFAEAQERAENAAYAARRSQRRADDEGHANNEQEKAGNGCTPKVRGALPAMKEKHISRTEKELLRNIARRDCEKVSENLKCLMGSDALIVFQRLGAHLGYDGQVEGHSRICGKRMAPGRNRMGKRARKQRKKDARGKGGGVPSHNH